MFYQMDLQNLDVQYGERIHVSLSKIRHLLSTSAQISTLDRFADCTMSALADRSDREPLLPWRCKFADRRPRTEDKVTLVFAEIAEAILLWWDFLRTANAPGIGEAISRLEGYAKHGFEQCEVLGDEDHGCYLFNPATQKAAVKEGL